METSRERQAGKKTIRESKRKKRVNMGNDLNQNMTYQCRCEIFSARSSTYYSRILS